MPHNRFLVTCPHCDGQFQVEPPPAEDESVNVQNRFWVTCPHCDGQFQVESPPAGE